MKISWFMVLVMCIISGGVAMLTGESVPQIELKKLLYPCTLDMTFDLSWLLYSHIVYVHSCLVDKVW